MATFAVTSQWNLVKSVTYRELATVQKGDTFYFCRFIRGYEKPERSGKAG
jgi:hypothetical protein